MGAGPSYMYVAMPMSQAFQSASQKFIKDTEPHNINNNRFHLYRAPNV